MGDGRLYQGGRLGSTSFINRAPIGDRTFNEHNRKCKKSERAGACATSAILSMSRHSAAIMYYVFCASPPSMQAKQPRSTLTVCSPSPPSRTRTLLGTSAIPDGVIGIDADAVRDTVSEVSPHAPVRQTSVGGDGKRGQLLTNVTRRRSRSNCRALWPCHWGRRCRRPLAEASHRRSAR